MAGIRVSVHRRTCPLVIFPPWRVNQMPPPSALLDDDTVQAAPGSSRQWGSPDILMLEEATNVHKGPRRRIGATH